MTMQWKVFLADVADALAKYWLVLLGVIILALYVEVIWPMSDERKNTVCPSYLSIARSARDTLIVMRNDSQCATYVLEHL